MLGIFRATRVLFVGRTQQVRWAFTFTHLGKGLPVELTTLKVKVKIILEVIRNQSKKSVQWHEGYFVSNS